jgi:acyl-[acyl-carrier-protein]-phospholipid O-acyltransferase/long-chain-fatty-acid--[acyl-carrier-protein] ligase
MCALIVWRFPLLIVRAILWLLSSTVYRLRVRGRDNVPVRGGGLIVANHKSFLDALVLIASIDRPVRFIVSPDYFEVWWLRMLARVMNAAPIDGAMGRDEFRAALQVARDTIEEGELACILANVDLNQVDDAPSAKKNFLPVLEGLDAPIIPVCIDRLLGDVYEVIEGRYRWKVPPRLPYRIVVSFGEPMPPDSTAYQVHRQHQELDVDAFNELDQPLIHRSFVRGARRHPFRQAMGDMRLPKASYGFALISSIALARKLKRLLDDQPMVGVLIPQSVGGALVNIALQLMGKVPVNLNYTASAQATASAARQCEITQVITSKAFLERMPVEVPGEAIYAEDIKESMTSKDRAVALLMALLLPVQLLERAVGSRAGRSGDDLATVIFSSGSEGDPKGVMLTQFNIASNCDGMLRTFPHKPTDALMGILPLFHSFGFTGTLWAPLIGGLNIVFHPNPLEARAVGSLCRKYQGRFLICTATFCQAYIRRCKEDDFKTLKYVITGAEKLPARVREAFAAKFGVEPLEGYGTTECAPVVSFNMPDNFAPGLAEENNRHGTIGKPIASVAVRTINPDTGELLEEDEVGMLQVKGPNIMTGYLGLPEKTAEVLNDGWYTTGDIASISVEGFTRITDRLARFSKIGGEMVPHGKIEEMLHELLGLTEQALVVTGVPDEMKGERLVVLHTLSEEQVEEGLAKLSESDLPKLWLPRPSSFYRIEEIPILGTGKTDIRAVRDMARQLDLGE